MVRLELDGQSFASWEAMQPFSMKILQRLYPTLGNFGAFSQFREVHPSTAHVVVTKALSYNVSSKSSEKGFLSISMNVKVVGFFDRDVALLINGVGLF